MYRSVLAVPTKYVLAVSVQTCTKLISTRFRSRPFTRPPPCPIWNIVSHWFHDPNTDMTCSPPPLSPTFTGEDPFPPLPPVHDNDIRTKVFTHRSFYARPNHVFEDHPDDPSPDNEK